MGVERHIPKPLGSWTALVDSSYVDNHHVESSHEILKSFMLVSMVHRLIPENEALLSEIQPCRKPC